MTSPAPDQVCRRPSGRSRKGPGVLFPSWGGRVVWPAILPLGVLNLRHLDNCHPLPQGSPSVQSSQETLAGPPAPAVDSQQDP